MKPEGTLAEKKAECETGTAWKWVGVPQTDIDAHSVICPHNKNLPYVAGREETEKVCLQEFHASA